MNEAGAPARRPALRRLLPIGVLAAGFAAFLALGLGDAVGLDALGRHQAKLAAFVGSHAVPAALLFVAAYALAVAFSLPVGVFFSIAAGLLFGVVEGTILTLAAATLGAIGVFLAARTAFREPLRRRAAPWLARLEAGFRRDAVSYLLTLRLIPVVPFWLVNLVPAFLGVGLGTFAATTLIGILPATLVFVGLGDGLGSTLASGAEPDPGIVLEPRILLPLLGLALLALLPALVRAGRQVLRRRASRRQESA